MVFGTAGRHLRSTGVACALLSAVLFKPGAGEALAQGAHIPDPKAGEPRRFEISVGGDATQHSTSVFATMTGSLAGDIREDGWRVRTGGGYGTYSYTSPRWNGAARVPVAFDGLQTYADLLLGYHVTIGPWIVKAYVGGSYERHDLTPFDLENPVHGGRAGVKAVLETWLSIGETAFVQTDTSWSQMFEAYGTRARLGYRLTPSVSVGIEAAAIGNLAHDSGRAGSFARYEWAGGEISVSGGGAGDISGVTGAYGSVGFLVRY
jgi:hypothetical protein